MRGCLDHVGVHRRESKTGRHRLFRVDGDTWEGRQLGVLMVLVNLGDYGG